MKCYKALSSIIEQVSSNGDIIPQNNNKA